MDDKNPSRILHIDSPPAFLRFVENYCRSKGLATDSTESESQGFHYALAKRYKAILIGAHAPRIDAGRILKGLARARVTTPVFLFTERADKDAGLMGLHPNLMGLISKPLDLKEFSRCLEYVGKPPAFDPGERERINAVLTKWERSASHAG